MTNHTMTLFCPLASLLRCKDVKLLFFAIANFSLFIVFLLGSFQLKHQGWRERERNMENLHLTKDSLHSNVKRLSDSVKSHYSVTGSCATHFLLYMT